MKPEIIASDAFQRGLLAIKRFAQKCASFQVEEIRAFGTSALRGAKNSADFLREIKNQTQIEIQIISGEDEATLIYRGVKWSYDFNERAAIMDIGGGSTEFIIANTSGIEEGFGEKEGYATEYIRDIQEDANYSFKELNTQENSKYIVVAWIDCQLGKDNTDLFEKAMDSVKQYLGSESVYEPTTHNFHDVFAVSLFAGHWDLGFRRWLKSRLNKAMEAKA